MKRAKLFLCINLISLAVLPTFAYAQANGIFTLTTNSLQNDKTVELDKAGWKYHAGDDARWAAPEFDDSKWSTLNVATHQLEKLDQIDWRGAGWFRLRFKTEESLRSKVLGLMMSHALGATEIYLDGELVRRFGEIGDAGTKKRFVNIYGTPFAITLGNADEHLLAVRYRSAIENPETSFSKWVYSGNTGDGFHLVFADLNEAVARREQTQRSSATTAVTRASIYLAVGLLYLFLFWFYPQQRANLYFGLYAFLTALSNFIAHAQSASSAADLTAFIVYRLLFRFLFLSYSLAFLLFLYRAFLPRTPRFFVFAGVLWAITNIATLLFPQSSISTTMFGIMTVLFVFESLRVMWLAVRRRAEGAWIVAAGVLTALVGPLRYLYLAAGFVIPKEVDFYLAFVSSYGMLAAVSIYLARRFARTNKDLARQLDNVQELSARELEHERTEADLRVKHEQERAENERRARELEEARQLQLSMLPKKLPQLPGLEIAAYMKPATEVGGDYYDFHVSGEGTLTAVVGDATGHGLKAGTMVTAMKSLFNNLADEPDIGHIFRQSSSALKRMNLRGLFMGLTMLKIKDGRLLMSAAGMPPVLVHRAATRAVEELTVKAMPLGSPLSPSYVLKETTLADGDCVLLMSDGFPERFNESGEMMDEDRARALLAEVAHEPAQEIINRFVRAGDGWAGARAQDDDVTFVVLKVKEQTLSRI